MARTSKQTIIEPAGRLPAAAQRWLLAQATPALLQATEKTPLYQNDPLYFYEHYLQANDPDRRMRRGVFYTPQPIVQFIVRGVDELLRTEFGLPDGLADTATWGEMTQRHPQLELPSNTPHEEPFVRLLDPAVGSGAFLVEVIQSIHATMTAKWQVAGHDRQAIQRLWNDYVPRHLLPRLLGFEIMPVPHGLALLNIAATLAETGFDFQTDVPLNVFRADTLAEPLVPPQQTPANQQLETARLHLPVTVIVGNPPFLADSNNRHPWIEALLRGKQPDGQPTASYYQIDGQPLGERKLWLHDDYVKFIRYAQWRIEQTGGGIVGLVTNHGYLDNPTFRGMREKLLSAFSRISILDLHGNKKKKEQSPDGTTDENVFNIEQGVAVGFFRRPLDSKSHREVLRADLWGDREKKYRRLTNSTFSQLAATTLQPQTPHYFFVARDESLLEQYQQGFKLTDIMPVNTTAPVTARDGFVIAIDEAELLMRMREFADLSIPDAEIRRRYFNNSRSRKYPPGDTRGWKLHDARQKMACEPDLPSKIKTCQYRPFDRRPIFWTDWMIDWPRERVMRHLQAGNNVALIARRQMLPTQPCNYFWITDEIALDGVIRSDNRGSESLFPLYLLDDRGSRHANFAISFLESASTTLSLQWLSEGDGDLQQTFGPDDLLHYIYALFFSPTYRKRYADCLRVDFPRIFLPHSTELFRSLCRAGAELESLNLLLDKKPAHQPGDESRPIIQSGFPKYRDNQVAINTDVAFDEVPREVWDYQVGGHQVCRKWLKDRRGRQLSSDEIAHYRKIVNALSQTLRLEKTIDREINNHGGFSKAFFTANA